MQTFDDELAGLLALKPWLNDLPAVKAQLVRRGRRGRYYYELKFPCADRLACHDGVGKASDYSHQHVHGANVEELPSGRALRFSHCGLLGCAKDPGSSDILDGSPGYWLEFTPTAVGTR